VASQIGEGNAAAGTTNVDGICLIAVRDGSFGEYQAFVVLDDERAAIG
jgi:hypothetical protein